MRFNRRLIPTIAALAMISLAAAGCATPFGERLKQTLSAIPTAISFVSTAAASEVSSKAVLVAAGVFDGVEVTAKSYLRLRPCSDATVPVCRQPAATMPIINAIHAGRIARKAALKFLKEHPCPKDKPDCPIGAGGVYDALQAAIATGQQIFAEYQVNATVSAAKPR